jgi:beta-xylosidase
MLLNQQPSMFFLPLLLPILSPTVASLGIEQNVAVEPYWADPSLILVEDVWYSFSSASGGHNVPAAISSDSYAWTRIANSDILPNLPSWAANDGNIWAPDVSQRGDGTFVLYFSATFAGSSPAYHCVGVATSANILGPFTPTSNTEPWTCNATQGGAIDPNLFHDSPSGNTYVVWKIDGTNTPKYA